MANVAQRNFAGGEIAPALYARTDVVKYATGLRTLRNFIVQKHGGVANRPGTRYVCSAKNSTKTARLIKFVFNASQTYVLEFGDLYIRFIQNGAQVLSGGVPYEIVSPFTEAELPELRFAQSADVVTITHSSHPPQELKRLAHTNWTIGNVIFAPPLSSPGGLGATGGTAITPFRDYAVTVVDSNGEESVLSTFVAIAAKPSDTAPIVITWLAVAGAAYYNVYSAPDGVTMGFLGVATGLSFSDTGLPIDFSQTPPRDRQPFGAVNSYPTAVGYTQQRRLFANTNTEPEKVWTSRIGQPRNLTTSFPLQDDDAITFALAGDEVNAVMHLLELGRLIVFTTGGEHLVEGDDAGVLRPTAINPRKFGYGGSGRLRPLRVVDTALYVQSSGQLVRDLRKAIADFESSDLTVNATHLFGGYTVADWDYQQLPNSVIWAVRDDGVLLGLTYIREQDIWGWHRHDTDGSVENVCCVQEGSEYAVYLIVKRTVNGSTVRYIERFVSRAITPRTDKRDLVFMDASLAYDGRNTGAETMTISGGSTWAYDELLTLTRSVGGFIASDATNNNVIQFTLADGSQSRFRITSYTSGTVVQGFAEATVPAELRGVASSKWARAVKNISGLAHLEGKAVSVFADGYVVASPKNPDYPVLTVSGGAITLPSAYAVVQVGLPYFADFETLDIDSPSGRSLKETKMNVSKVGLVVESSHGIFAGRQAPESDPLNVDSDPLYKLDAAKVVDADEYDLTTALLTGDIEVPVDPSWDSTGRIFVRQVDPVPLTILSARPTGLLPIA